MEWLLLPLIAGGGGGAARRWRQRWSLRQEEQEGVGKVTDTLFAGGGFDGGGQ